MIRRLLFIFVFALSFIAVFISVFATCFIMAPLALLIYIIHGDKNDILMDFITTPVEWATDLPYKIMGKK